MSHPSAVTECPQCAWYALCVRARAEQTVAGFLQGKGFESYVPCLREVRQYSDRRVRLTVAAFPGYVFSRFDREERLTILNTQGVRGIVGSATGPAPIEDEVILNLRKALSESSWTEMVEYLPVGERVRIVDGPMAGVEGLLLRVKGRDRLIISVDVLQRSVAVEVDASHVIPLTLRA